MNSVEKFVALVQAILSGVYLLGTFAVIMIYELGYAKLTPGQEKSFDSLSNWLTGGALIILYFWFQRSRPQSTPDGGNVIIDQTTVTKMKRPPTPGDPNAAHETATPFPLPPDLPPP